MGSQVVIATKISWRQMAIRMKRFMGALFLGCALGLFPLIVEKLPLGSGPLRSATNAGDILSFPGYTVALVLARGRFHNISFAVLVSASVVIYSGLAYLVLTILGRVRQPDQNQRRFRHL